MEKYLDVSYLSKPSQRFRHTVALELMCGDFKARLVRTIEGNVRGNSCLVFADLDDFYPHMAFADNAKHAVVDDEEGYITDVRFFNDSGEELILDEAQAKDFLIGTRIVSVEVLD